MRLVKKTVNQDDVEAYHLFFADDKGSAGTDMTFFQFTMSHSKVDGTDSIHRTSFRVPSDLESNQEFKDLIKDNFYLINYPHYSELVAKGVNNFTGIK